jgi:hypothetical protein
LPKGAWCFAIIFGALGIDWIGVSRLKSFR